MATINVLSEACQKIYGHELPDDVRADYDWISDDELSDYIFFTVEGVTHCVSDFLRCDDYTAQGFHAAYSENAFSALLIGIIDGDDDNLKVGRVC
ncbi:hypothetical protein MA12_gp15 [Pectobacterium phage MA12]|uniref:Uncharacterized protein n=1 Tax=Pectobacterium phage MA12 TaxID=2686474 RepID=A0A6B9RI03_9CAUD|nr:hypothetical protein JT356_gp03 [Pectobacterium phage MA11]YP_010000237.1 hypothetical protein JT357_gp15 [Pectobacterium phage MA12]QGF21028.1 hypothetical protein MA11_gp03 [Pectobacterium phage MA11]QHI00842.1 hypothetical protein MA12_gp15 [Pectobacterium phage MA12]